MKKSVISYFSNSKGITLIELLLALTIVSIVLTVSYPILTNGIRNFQEINSEVQLRSEADYIIGKILNEIYLFYPDTVEQLTENKIVMKRTFDGTNPTGSSSRYAVEHGIIGNPKIKRNEELILEFENENIYMIKIDHENNETKLQLNGESIKLLTKEQIMLDIETPILDEALYSKISLVDCPSDRPCKNGSLKITLVIDFLDDEIRRNDPLKLESSFGF